VRFDSSSGYIKVGAFSSVPLVTGGPSFAIVTVYSDGLTMAVETFFDFMSDGGPFVIWTSLHVGNDCVCDFRFIIFVFFLLCGV
jgi:hypothetical protein